MKRILGAALLISALAGCGALTPTASESPTQVVNTASQKMSQLSSAKFDVTATLLEQFPAAFTQSLGAQGAALSNLSIDMSGKGQAKFPDAAAMTLAVKTGSVSVSTDVVVVAGKTYIKDPQSGTYIQPQGVENLSQFSSQADPLSATGVLKAVQSIKDLGDTTIGGVAVHHYQIVPDKAKLADQASTQQAKNLVQQALQNGTVRIEVWIGKDDHLLRRVKDDADATIDLNQALQAVMGSAQMPPGSTVHTTAHTTIEYHDFNAPVTVTAPPVSPS
jgi:LppX/LprAFG-like lipoprotein